MSRNEVRPAVTAADFVEHAERYQGLLIYSHLRELFSRLNVTCVWDVGANVGQFASMVRSFTGYDGWMLSFEPVSQAYEKLVERAEGDERWKVFRIALGPRNEERAIKVAQNAVLSSFLDSSDYSVEIFGRMTSVAKEEVVSVRTIDSIAAEVMEGLPDSRIFLKLDTQGWDLEVLRGAEDSLSRVVGLQTELSVQHIYQGTPHYTEALALLESKGFQLTGLYPVVRDKKLGLIELDCVMVRPAEVSPPRSTRAADQKRQNRIPADQQYETFTSSSAKWSISYPQGWAVSGSDANRIWTGGLDGLHVVVGKGEKPTVALLRDLIAKQKDLEVISPPQQVEVNGQPAIKATVLQGRSLPDGREARIYTDQYRMERKGRTVAIDISCPFGVYEPNSDDFKRMVDSFRWQ